MNFARELKDAFAVLPQKYAGKSANAIESKNQDPWTLEQPSEIQCYQALFINPGGRGLSQGSKFGTDNRYWGVTM